jgi:hypothetical protein
MLRLLSKEFKTLMFFKKVIRTSSSFHQQHSSSILKTTFGQNLDRVAIKDKNGEFKLLKILSESIRVSRQIQSLIGKSTTIC